MNYDFNGELEKEPFSRFSSFKNFINLQVKLGNIIELSGCSRCRGTGLNHWKQPNLQGSIDDYCLDCKGSGIKKIELKEGCGAYVCHNCNGLGYINGCRCVKCKGNGFLDWIENILGVEK